jgi:hypothetical protein
LEDHKIGWTLTHIKDLLKHKGPQGLRPWLGKDFDYKLLAFIKKIKTFSYNKKDLASGIESNLI